MNNLEKYWGNYHIHTDKDSNLRFLDSTLTIQDTIDYAEQNNLGFAYIGGHESLSSHVTAERYYHSKERNFPLLFGDEIYLVNQNSMEKAEQNNEKFKYYHFLVTALDKKGHDFLQEQSTIAWSHYHMYHGQERVPTYYNDLAKLMAKYRGHVVGSTSCLGGQFSQLIQKYNVTKDNQYLDEAHRFVQWCINLFGKDYFYMELMPSKNPLQKLTNKFAIKFAKEFGIRYIITVDAHYKTLSDREIHTALLHSRNRNRDITAYNTAHLFTLDELRAYFSEDVINHTLESFKKIVSQVQDYTFYHAPILPETPISDNLEYPNLDKVDIKYKNIYNFYNSKVREDNAFLSECLKGFVRNHLPYNEQYLSRLNLEIGELIKISNKIKQPMSVYFLAEQNLLKIAWKIALVGPGRGSASCWLSNFLLDLVQVDAVKYDLPYYRFLSAERVSENKADQYPDIDEDFEASKKQDVIELFKKYYGYDKVLNVATFTTVGSHSAILMGCRALNLPVNIANYLTTLIPSDSNGKELPLKTAILGDEKKNIKPNKRLISALDQYKLTHVCLGLVGLVVGRSVHASAVVIDKYGLTTHNAFMNSTKRINTTQYDASDTEYCGLVKFDILALSGLDTVRNAIDLLIADKKIRSYDTIKQTYDTYFNANVLDYNNQDMYDKLFDGSVIDAFQFSGQAGEKTLKKLNARNLNDLVSGNALMRLTGGTGEQPLDKYIRYRSDSTAWDKDMIHDGLNESERKELHGLLDAYHGICFSQEMLMLIGMRIGGFDLLGANKLRKSIAKKDPKLQAIQHDKFIKSGLKHGKREVLLNYVWENCIKTMLNYSFSQPHGLCYTIILLVEMNICERYGSIYWQTAVLTTQSGALGSNTNPDYGKVAKAISMLPKGLVISPDINNSKIGFVPFHNHILFGLASIAGIGFNEIDTIIKNRPYTSVFDFYKRNKEDVSNKKMIILMKSGAFNNLNPNRRQLIINFIKYIIKPKEKLTSIALRKTSKNDVPVKYHKQYYAYMLEKHLKKPVKDDSQAFTYLDNNLLDEIKNFEDKLKKKPTEDIYHYDDDNINVVVDIKRYHKFILKYIKPLKEWLNTPEAKEQEANIRRSIFWRDNCLGTDEQWYFESLYYYPTEHFLSKSDLNKIVTYRGFNDCDENPKPIRIVKTKKYKYPIYPSETIVGTVIDKISAKKAIVLLTTNGVAHIKLGEKLFSKYGKTTSVTNIKGQPPVVDKSWFDRGTNLVIRGTRKMNDFKVSGYKQDNILKIVNDGYHTRLVQDKIE